MLKRCLQTFALIPFLIGAASTPHLVDSLKKCSWNASKNILSFKTILGGEEIVFLTWDSCSNGKLGYLWQGFTIKDGKPQPLETHVQFYEGWHDPKLDKGSLLFANRVSTDLQHIYAVTLDGGKVVQNKVAEIHGSKDSPFQEWLRSLVNLRPVSHNPKTFQIGKVKLSFFKDLLPEIKFVATQHEREEANGFYLSHRIILKSTEEDPCLTLETLFYNKGPKGVEQQRLCNITSAEHSYNLEHAQDIDYEAIVWKKDRLEFTLFMTPGGKNASRQKYFCHYTIGKKTPHCQYTVL